MARARVFALSSNVEGFPNALVEALALNLPIVATNCPDGPAEILAGKTLSEIDGLTEAAAGILVPVDDTDSFAAGLKLAFDGVVRDRLVAGANHRAENFSPARAVDAYWQAIERSLAARTNVAVRTGEKC
jgi:N-acetylgalactosamine-N,N'-diacetylbacillosaminyl-diphospho-undecaprenol 4-alpha-N-acetylgalactosaminyltransferase